MINCMKKLPFLAALLATLILLACNRPLDLPTEPADEVGVALSKEDWKIPAQLTGDLATDLATIETLVEVDLDEGLDASASMKKGNTVYLDANSTDELQAKVNAAGPNGTVIVRAGDHTETTTVNVNHRVAILGEPGAVIKSGVPNLLTAPTVVPAIHVKNANYTLIAGIKFMPTSGGQDGGTAILVENSLKVITTLNEMTGFQFGILLQEANKAKVVGNDIAVSDIAVTQGIPAHGIVLVNGDKATVHWNEVTNGFFGIWACDEKGSLLNNYTHHNIIGVNVCNVPLSVPLPSGQVVGSLTPATRWNVRHNISSDNFNLGYLVIDGANNNVLRNNTGGNNTDYDMELTGDTDRFGFPTPASYENRVKIVPPGFTIKDCGNNNVIVGGVQIDINLDPCN
jgi:hypothetical protein